MAKDCWDKLEIFGKVLIPFAVGAGAFFLNMGLNERTTAAQMTQIAVGVLMEKPENSENITDDPLREWAITVLQQPDKITPLSSDAARELRTRRLPAKFRFLDNGLDWPSFETDPPVIQEPYRPNIIPLPLLIPRYQDPSTPFPFENMDPDTE